MIWVYQIFTVLYVITLVLGSSYDPYKILGVFRTATIPEIKRAYKQLAKEWHPDKNDDPSAPDKFMEITQAYELLTDPDRKKKFDNFGRVNVDERPRPEYEKKYEGFDEVLGGFRFKFNDRDITIFHKLTVSTRAYESLLIPKSFRKPYLVLFYSDWCFACLQVEPVWRRIMEELDPIGVGLATIHAENEKPLARKAGVSSLPYLMLLSDGRLSSYRESLYSVQKIVEFVRYRMPYQLVPVITDDSLDSFLNGWNDNKVRALVFQRTESLRLRYLTTAFYHRERVAFGFVPPGIKTEGIRSKYQVSSEQDTLLVFNENTERPVASVSMSDIPVPTMHDVIKSNNYLLLPRLSSQTLLDDLCPSGLPWSRRKLCVVLVCGETPSHEPHKQSLRRFALESRYSKERVRFMYVYQERQPHFISALTSGKDSPSEPLLHVAILCRRDVSHVKYEWITGEETWQSYNSTKHHLELAIDRVLHTSQALPNEAVIGELIDEQTQGIVTRVITRILHAIDYLQEHLSKEHVLPVVSVIGTAAFICIAAYTMAYLMKLEEKRVKESYGSSGFGGKSINGYQPQLKIHEMRAETYNGLVRLLRPGCRTILLIVDNQSIAKLLPSFHKYVWPYRKNKTLMFATLNLDKRGRSWYTEILSQSLVEPRELTINPKNCVGTVLSLNGLRKYFCMYHAKHPEGTSKKANARMKRIMNRQSGSSASFIGFEDTTSESDLSDIEQGHRQENGKTDEVIYVEHLLDGLPNWLDRLFEGMTHRYFLNYWPDFGSK